MQQHSDSVKLSFANGLINKRQLKNLMYGAFLNYGVVKSSIIADRVKNLTFHYATKSGISLSIEDLRVPYKKIELLGLTSNEVSITTKKYDIGNATGIERFQKTIDIWNNTNNFLKDEVLFYFRESDPLNPLYIMAFSGARGNISQVRQLVGMRGLMADPQGQIIDLPIRSNFREGLNVTEYIISSYGARKGLVDTALRTADSGYLTRRLVDVAQDIIIREEDCGTEAGLFMTELDGSKTYNPQRLIGRTLAEDIVEKDGTIYGSKGSEITPTLVEKLHDRGKLKIKVRSPLTCKSMRSICRSCYGWHLAYSRLVDLGEAVGIVAAQSIGEPGTQLTMRTFHTGGVFSGDLTYQVRSPYKGTITYNSNIKAFLFRTLHGEMGFRVTKKMTLFLRNCNNTSVSFSIPPGGILLVNNRQKVYSNEVIAEIKKDANVTLEEEQKDIFTEESGELYFLNEKLPNEPNEEFAQFQKKANLIWVLNGKIYSLYNFSPFKLEAGTLLSKDRILSRLTIRNRYSGVAKLVTNHKVQRIDIFHYSATLNNLIGQKCGLHDYRFKITANSLNAEFSLTAPINKPLKIGDTMAVLIDDTYRTETGGIVTYSLKNNVSAKRKKNLRHLFSGSFYWIPEETFQQNEIKSFNFTKVRNGDFIKPGTEILPNIFSKTGGLLHINNVEQKVVIKPGELFKISNITIKNFAKNNRFIKPGEAIIPNRLIAQSLVYIEFFKIFEVSYMLIRPVKTYSLSKVKSFYLEHKFFPEANSQKPIRIKIVKKFFYKNWETIASSTGVDLVKTFLVPDIKNLLPDLQAQVSLISFKTENIIKYLIKISLCESIKLKNIETKNLSNTLKTRIRYLVKDQQYLYSNTPLVYQEILLQNPGILGSVVTTKNNEKELLILENRHFKSVPYNCRQENLQVKVGDLVRIGTVLAQDLKSTYTGQIYKILPTSLLIRLGQPYLLSSGTILRVKNGALVKVGDTLATLVYEKLKTTDIVQGLPKVEEILEARKIKNLCVLSPCPGYAYLRPKTNSIEIFTLANENFSITITQNPKIRFRNGQYVDLAEPLTEGVVSPHNKLTVVFSYFKEKYPLHKAYLESIKSLQLFLVNEIQNTYLNQGVQIADKHIEVIVRQMTSKVCIEDPGSTTFLPGEVMDFRKVNAINEIAQKRNDIPISYTPVLLGITKASLNSDSFISAASFQETTRVLTEAAVEGKKDWLNGLKENVIIGRLIPAGTGFSYEENRQMLDREKKYAEKLFQSEER
uniref:RNA polymerase beta'' subunit n=1 Tax=Ochrosphaera neapolitana TaxID=35137 RepID=UPI00286C8D9C|nr:RNA polymerase beta'' subunit [Ochrosphaera neapolitana]WKK50097.1 RNA polymerase beta'' subunit [Ochrosphaera neapolitana]